MAATADREYGCINPDDFIDILAGGADTLFKGAVISAGTDGYAKVAANAADEVPLGLCKKQVVAAGSHAEHVEIDVGVLAVAKKAQHTTTVAPGDGGESNINYNSKYFVIYNGTTGYYCWFDVNSGGSDPEVAGLTGCEIDIGTADDAATVGGKIATAIQAIGGGAGGTVFTASGTTTVTILAVNRGANTASNAGNITCVTLVNAYYGTAVQSDVGLLFYTTSDDGVVPEAQNGDSTVALGLCIGLVGRDNELWIDTRKKLLQ